ncbi:P-loop ATPase, Sll1717 family [Brevundimonas naejangsanensis]|uniref:P-loop ATPase, Sll1717 family n=1 Tax=Brevundimonas naejangsanensis TaxID=588932 RepID=UPI003D03D47F
MSNTIFSLSGFDSFGDVAAEDDAVLNYFLATKAVENIEKNSVFMALGRKGTGKTALVRYFTEGAGVGQASKSLNLRGYPWNVHAARMDHGASPIEAYVSSWKYLIAVELASLVLSHRDSWKSLSSKTLTKFLNDNYGGTNPDLSEILRPQRLALSKLSFNPSVMGNALGGIDLERSGKDHRFGLELNALSGSIMSAVVEVAKDTGQNHIKLHFDELDQGMSTLEDDRAHMLIGLVLAAREVRRGSGSGGVEVTPVVYLRTDLWDELQFSDKNKISQTLALNIVWNGDNLLELVEARLQSKLGAGVSWSDVAESDLMRGSQRKWDHILARTFLRPRDVIHFLNIILAEAKKRAVEPTHFTNQDIINSRDEYSQYLKRELDDEIGSHWPQWEEAVQALSTISTITFGRGEFEQEYSRRKSRLNKISDDDALALLYRFSVIGYQRRSGYGGSSWAFQYTDPEAGWDNGASRFKVHPGLKEYAKLREKRGND